jgi:hypothetical protein
MRASPDTAAIARESDSEMAVATRSSLPVVLAHYTSFGYVLGRHESGADRIHQAVVWPMSDEGDADFNDSHVLERLLLANIDRTKKR